jgi:hypothetical protein
MGAAFSSFIRAYPPGRDREEAMSNAKNYLRKNGYTISKEGKYHLTIDDKNYVFAFKSRPDGLVYAVLLIDDTVNTIHMKED